MLSWGEAACGTDFILRNCLFLELDTCFERLPDLRIFESRLKWRASVRSMVVSSICRRILFMSTHRGTLICLPAVRGKERNDRFAAHIGEIRGRLQGTIASVGASPLRV